MTVTIKQSVEELGNAFLSISGTEKLLLMEEKRLFLKSEKKMSLNPHPLNDGKQLVRPENYQVLLALVSINLPSPYWARSSLRALEKKRILSEEVEKISSHSILE